MPQRILEIGTGDGAATLELAAALPADGLLITMEPDASLAAIARQRFAAAGLGDRISVIVGEPARFLHKIRGPFDLIVIRRPDAALRARLDALATGHGLALVAPPLRLCTDNAAMIALAGAERLGLGFSDDLSFPARPRWPLDEAAAASRPSHKPGRKGAKA